MYTKRIGWTLLAVVMVTALVACTGSPAASLSGAPSNGGMAQVTNPPVRQLTASGQGKVYMVPDLAYIFIGVHSEAATVAEALKDNNSQAQAIQKALTDMGVDAKDIQTSAFNIYPQQQPDAKGEPGKTTYVVENTVNVTVRDLSKLGVLLDKVASSGANSIHGIQFDVKDKEKALSDARKQAIDNAKKQAAELAQAAGVQLGAIQSLNVYAGNQPGPLYQSKAAGMALAADSSVPVSSGQLLVTAEANLVFEIK